LFSRVMRAKLSTNVGAKWPEIVLSGPIFSEPVHFAASVVSLQALDLIRVLPCRADHFDVRGENADGTEIEHSLRISCPLFP